MTGRVVALVFLAVATVGAVDCKPQTPGTQSYEASPRRG